MRAHRSGYLAKYRAKSQTGTGRAVVASPVGAIVTDQGVAFAVEPVDLAAVPVRVRCSCCPWQATVTGLAAAWAEATRHAGAHEHDPRPVTAIGGAA